jgi:ketosteroid isomerase-like protein
MDDARLVLTRLHAAMNAHDIDAFVACFAPDYRSDQPVYPNRHFVGNGQVRANWSRVFDAVPDFQAELRASAVVENTIWSEWRWTGARRDGGRLEMAGVILLGVRDAQIAWGRLYVDDVAPDSVQIDEAVGQMTRSSTGP